ncbi:MAG: DUF1674 domain-containing protein [Gammaproteobacteria bacterium]
MTAKPENSSPEEDAIRPEPASRQEETGHREPPKEIGGRPGPDPTRYGDWEKNGRCIDF